MSYYVNIGGINLHAIESVKVDADRDITDYDGLGSGRFDVPENAGLKEYTINCELQQKVDPKFKGTWSASELFKQFDTWRAQKDSIRLVITSDRYPAENISILVTFKSYSKTEKSEGINDTEIHLKEYKPVGIKTTDVPYITRPGKLPAIPKTVTITSKSTSYGTTKKYTGTSPTLAADFKKLDYADVKTGKPATNPSAVKSNTTLTLGSYITDNTYKAPSTPAYPTVVSTEKSAAQKWLESVGTSISNAFTSWQNNAQKTKLGK